MRDEPSVPLSHHVIACRGGRQTALERRPLREPGDGEMLLGLRVVGLCGTDLFKLDTNGAAPGTVLGHELVGEVLALGPGVERFRPGDRVAVPHHVACGQCRFCETGNETMCETFRENLLDPGGFADAIVVRRRATEQAAHRVPDHVADEAAVFMEPAACVLRGVRRSGLDTDGVAVILGAGSMGLLHLLVIRAALAEAAVIVIDPVDERRAMAARLGASATAVPGSEAATAVANATAGRDADAVFDTVGGEGALADGLRLTRPGGSVVLFAHAPADGEARIDLNQVFKFERRILGTYSAALDEQAEVFRLIANGTLDPSPLVTHTMPLDEFERGVELARRRQALKVLFTPSRRGTAP